MAQEQQDVGHADVAVVVEILGAGGDARAPGAEQLRKELNTFDETLGRFIDGLKALGLFDSSIIVLVSDTGNDKGADSFVTDQTKIMDTPELAHIIMMIKDRAQDRRRDFYSTVRQIDVVPTLLAKLNAEVKQGSFDGQAIRNNWF